MSFEEEDNRWICGRVGAVHLQRVSSIVRDIREPCLHHTPAKGNKMLKPDKWQTVFDSDGRILGFKKALKLIILGGVDPSIRAEVWEFLLGCYALGTTSEYRRQLRMARRERYMDLISQCQKVHSSIGTGNLAYVVGSKVMDMRTLSKENGSREAEGENGQASHGTADEVDQYGHLNNNRVDKYSVCQRESSTDSHDLASVRGSTDGVVYDTFSSNPESFFDFPPLPVTNLFQKGGRDELGDAVGHDRCSTEHTFRVVDGAMHSFQINNNVDLIIESNGSLSADLPHASNGEIEMHSSNIEEHVLESTNLGYETEMVDTLRISGEPDAAIPKQSTSNGVAAVGDKVAEWLWTLHRIVVDVVRTDSHLEFYSDSKNMARMSDILAVYAWVDPATGYCQGMSDLLSPFVVLYEDNADAFWCFEMLLRRMRENFQMEGPTGVMKQLQALWKILELTDLDIFTHLSLIHAESLHFAFRMLLVLFRRELSFTEALCMWEMMWAADFNETAAQELEANCLESLVVELPRDSVVAGQMVESVDDGRRSMKGAQCENGSTQNSECDNDITKSASSYPFCGLTSASFWARSRLSYYASASSTKNSDDELTVFCVAAILILNRQRILRATHSLDDLIKMFNDKMLKINVKRCIRMAIKLRKKYFYKLTRQGTVGNSEQLLSEKV
ncbi:rab GTPase-activating protein 22-like [Aristolochia californica]|uniref:rab GTPase-activating protein 22-like n=1 Tax=Aristolochia californica TaxID=171875 RepID=UPI0035D9BCD5